MCNICKKFDYKENGYSCVKDKCKYFVHEKCMNRNTFFDNEEIINLIKFIEEDRFNKDWTPEKYERYQY